MARRKAARPAGLDALGFDRELERAGLKPTYLLLGDESHLSESVRLTMRRELFDGANDSPSLTRFDAERCSVAEILDELRTLPFFGGGRRLVEVTHAEALLSVAEEELEGFFRYLAAPVSSAVLVLVAVKLDRRMKAAKRLLGATSVVLCEAPSEAQLRRWLEQRADPPFERGVVDVLIARCAGGKMGLAALVAEVDKLCLLAGPGGRIDRAMVESLVAESSADGLFDLVKPVSEGRTGAALEVLGNMLRDGAVDRSGKRQRDPRAITPMAIGTFRWDLARLWSAYALIQQGMREDAAQRALGGYGARDALRRARAASHGSLCARHDALRRADRAVKSGARALDTLTRLVIELSELSRPPAGRGARPPPGPSGRSRSSGSRP